MLSGRIAVRREAGSQVFILLAICSVLVPLLGALGAGSRLWRHRDRCPGSPLLLRAPSFAPPSSGAMPNAASHTPNVWPPWGCWAFARSEKPAADHAQRHAHRRASWLLRAGGRRPDPRKRSRQGNQCESLASCGTLLTACSPPSPGRARARTVEPARPGLR